VEAVFPLQRATRVCSPRGAQKGAELMLEGTLTREEPTAQLRWKAGVLEQRWSITTIQNGVTLGVEGEWRAVPSADDTEEQS
jgi:hypothetical protein